MRNCWMMILVGCIGGCVDAVGSGANPPVDGGTGSGGDPSDLGGGTPSPVPNPTPGDGGSAIWQLAPGSSWQWQIGSLVDTSVDVAVFDIDLFDTPPDTIASLQASGKKVICYFDTQYEPNRVDSGKFTADVLGNEIQGWPGQRWVDIRSKTVRDIMLTRLDLAVEKKCNAVEPDDVDGYTNNPGFPLTAQDQLDFNSFVADAAHQRGMAVALKNDLDQIAELLPHFDFALNEECFKFNECAKLSPFIKAGKAVLQVEYGDESLKATVCPQAITMNFDTLIKRLELDAWRVACR